MYLKNKLYSYIFPTVTFILLFASFTFNVFNVENDFYSKFDRGDEGYVLGKIMSSEVNGLFSLGGLPCNYVYYRYLPDENGNPVTTELWEGAERKQENLKSLPNSRVQAQMYDDYINNRKLADGYSDVYKTQPCMMGNVYSIIHTALPISNAYKLLLFRIINISLTTLSFILIAYWVRRNFGLAVGVITFLLILLSSWPMRFSHNLWWALWSYYIPFITMLLVLEKKQKSENKISDIKVLIYLFIAIFIKFAFTGAEFITSTLVMAICPIIYYCQIERRRVKQSILFFIKSSGAAIAGVLAGFLLLMTQIKIYEGTWQAGIDHIIFSFTKRSAAGDSMDGHSVWSIVKMYFTDSSIFLWNFAPNFIISFGLANIIIGGFCLLTYMLTNKYRLVDQTINNALILTTIISIAGPLSWIVIFVQHAYTHPLFDYITWYMPFCIYGFVVIGVGLKLSFQLISNSKTNIQKISK